jgi:hypothetical protein
MNLISESEESDLKFDFSFKTPLEASQTDEKNFWFEVGKILEFNSILDIINYLRNNHLLESQFPQEALSKLYEVINERNVINYYQDRKTRRN